MMLISVLDISKHSVHDAGSTDMRSKIIRFLKRRSFCQLLVIDRVWNLQMQRGAKKTDFHGPPRSRVTPSLCETCDKLDETEENASYAPCCDVVTCRFQHWKSMQVIEWAKNRGKTGEKCRVLKQCKDDR